MYTIKYELLKNKNGDYFVKDLNNNEDLSLNDAFYCVDTVIGMLYSVVERMEEQNNVNTAGYRDTTNALNTLLFIKERIELYMKVDVSSIENLMPHLNINEDNVESESTTVIDNSSKEDIVVLSLEDMYNISEEIKYISMIVLVKENNKKYILVDKKNNTWIEYIEKTK